MKNVIKKTVAITEEDKHSPKVVNNVYFGMCFESTDSKKIEIPILVIINIVETHQKTQREILLTKIQFGAILITRALWKNVNHCLLENVHRRVFY